MSGPKSSEITFLCLVGTLFVGLGCLFVMSQLDTLLPHFRLDVVLTQEELKDKALRESTLESLKASKSGHAPYWYATGTALVVLSSVGIWASFREMQRQGRSSS